MLDWFSPNQIVFSRPQVIWLLQNFELLLDGIWPSDHRKESGYTGSKGKHGHTAYYEKTKQVFAELVSRLYRAGPDSFPLLIAYSTELDQQYYIRDFLARCLRIDVTELDRRLKYALGYCCGWRRKQISYGRYCIQRRSYEKERARRLVSLAHR